MARGGGGGPPLAVANVACGACETLPELSFIYIIAEREPKEISISGLILGSRSCHVPTQRVSRDRCGWMTCPEAEEGGGTDAGESCAQMQREQVWSFTQCGVWGEGRKETRAGRGHVISSEWERKEKLKMSVGRLCTCLGPIPLEEDHLEVKGSPGLIAGWETGWRRTRPPRLCGSSIRWLFKGLINSCKPELQICLPLSVIKPNWSGNCL